MESLREFPHYLQSLVDRHGATAPRRQPKAGDFSLVEHACHLRDLEREGYRVRLSRILAEVKPELQGFDGATIAAARDYPSQDVRAAAADFAAARADLLAQVAALPPAAFERRAVMFGKEITLQDLLGMMAAHDAEHRAELEALDRWLASGG